MPFKLESIRLILEMTRRISDETLAGANCELEPVSENDIVLATLSDEIKRIFIASTQFAKLARVAEAKASLNPPNKDTLEAQQRRYEQLCTLSRELGWAEIIATYCKDKNYAHYHLKANWTLVAVECEHEHQDKEHKHPLAELIETIATGEVIPGGGFVRQVEDGSFMMAIDTQRLNEQVAKKRQEIEEEKLRNSKPN